MSRVALAGAAAALVLGAAAAAWLLVNNDDDAPTGPGRVLLVRNTAGDAGARLVTDSTSAERAFMRRHYWRMRGNPPFFDRALGWAPPSHAYQDLYALYPTVEADRRLVRRHPDWVLRDDGGRRLFIPYDCGGRGCAAWAADPGSAGWRAEWLRRAQGELSKGYAGLFIDNVSMEMQVGDGDGELVVPTDPRTGEAMTLSAWRTYVSEFTRLIEAALPKAEIVHNSIWYADRDDPLVTEQLRAADYVELERGFTDGGLRPGEGVFGFETFLEHVDRLHELGVRVILEPYRLDEERRYLELAGYLLINTGEDAIAATFGADPDNWWAGWEVDLGEPEGERYGWRGLLRRDFEFGMALVNPPGSPEAMIPDAQGLEDLDGNPAAGLTLASGSGIVLQGVH